MFQKIVTPLFELHMVECVRKEVKVQGDYIIQRRMLFKMYNALKFSYNISPSFIS
jgi:hypothetical protein